MQAGRRLNTFMSANKEKKYAPALYLSVFVSGAAVLVIEVTATRMLSPHFGMTLFTVSSVLTVVLTALSLGYWFGGKLIDRRPRMATLYGTILAAGATTLAMSATGAKLVPAWSRTWDLMSGPLFSAMILFFIPTFFLGMVSPIAIRLSATRVDTVGEVSGRIFFMGTLGSIVGSLTAGFFLIPRLPLSQIIAGTSAVLTALGLLGLLSRTKKATWAVLLAAASLVFFFSGRQRTQSDTATLYVKDSMYQHIRVVKHEFAEGEGRLLMLDRTFAGAGFLDSDELPFPYTRYFRLYELVNPRARRFLFLGGGAYTTPKKLLADRRDQIEVVVVEIDSKLPGIARAFFALPQDPRLRLVIDDARNYLSKTQERFDMMFIDVFSMDIGIPAHLMTKGFFQLVKDHLNESGVVIMNVAASVEKEAPSLGLSAIKTFREVFPQSEFFALRPDELQLPQNLIFFATVEEAWRFNEHDPRITQGESVMSTLAGHRIDVSGFDLTKHRVLTDDFAPIEYLVVRMLRNSQP